MALQRVLEPEVMDTPEEARDYDSMDHSEVNENFVREMLAAGPLPGEVLDLGTGTGQMARGLALRGEGLGMNDITSDDIEEAPDEALEHASSAFRINGELYQVPDLLQLQERVTAQQAAA